ncbi:SPG7_3 [Blepharisma stoltei]|uniref:TmcB/TmcC TPR repeats domain-containing protein n=1 Tax=Blepharisma stoltei TaxID=1481888 RepID=A0AAU9IY95_9CILI|nr:unnamed protein product [Blepharisma stoltei]
MSSDFEVGDKESNDFRSFIAESFFSNKLKEYVYGFFGHLFKEKYSHNTKFRMQVFYEILINFIIVLQLSPLAWYPEMKATGWDSYVWFWQDISYISYDGICAYYSIMNFCFYGTVIQIGACFGSFAIFWLYIYFDKKIPKFISILPKKIAMLMTSICIIPSTMILILVIKYSLINRATIEEYNNSLSSDTYNFGTYGVIFGIICLSALIFVNIFCEAFTCDMKHSHSKTNIKARACADFDLQRRWFYVISCVLNVFLGTDNAVLFQCISFLYSFYLYIHCIWDVQYFNPIENAIQASKMGSISALYFTFLFGQLLNDALVIIIFTLFLQPMVIFMTIWIVYKGHKNLEKSIHSPKDQFQFERKFRHLLTDENLSDKEEVINVFKKYWKQTLFHKDKLFVIWEFNFCFFIMKDEKLARIKISKIASAKSTFEGDAQEWRLFDWLIRKQHSVFPDTSYLEFLKEFSRVKSQDEELCFILTELHAEFSSRTPRIQKLVNLVNRSANHISFVDTGYKSLIEKHKNIEALEMYAGFLENIINNHDEANMAMKKKNGINFYNHNSGNNSLENYGKELATILVSCADDSFGTIVYLNEKASQLLKAPIGSIHGSSILNYIPQPYDALHENLIRNFIFECNSTEIIPHRQLFFQNHAGFLVETHFLIKLTAFHNCAYFLISFQPRDISRELAILSEGGIVIAHTEAFPYYIGIEEKSVKNKKLVDIVPVLDTDHMKELEPWLLPFNNTELMIVLMRKQIKTKTIRLLAVIHDDAGIKNWKEGNPHGQIDFLSSLNLVDQYDNDTDESPVITKPVLTVKFQQINYSLSTKTFDAIENETSTHFDNLGDKEKADQEKLSDNNSQSASTKTINPTVANYSKKLFLESKKKIRALQIILFVVMFSVIITVAAILGYMKSDVLYTTRLKGLIRFSQVLYDISSFAEVARSISQDALNNDINSEDINSLQKLIENITAIQDEYFNDFKNWKHYPNAKKPICLLFLCGILMENLQRWSIEIFITWFLILF